MSDRRIAITTLGCKANQFDSEVMREKLVGVGFREVPFDQKADVYVINTCTVTGKSDYQSRQLIRRAHRLNPDAIVIATGCYAEVFPQVVRSVAGVSAVLGNQGKQEVASFLSRLVAEGKPVVHLPPVPEGPLRDYPVKGFSRHSRAFLKIQDGCNAACSYCIVPRARGKSRSLPPDEVLRHLARLKVGGYEEVVLTGIHLGSYGLDLSPVTSLADLIERIEKTPVAPLRIRLSSVEPTDFSHALLSAVKRSTRIPTPSHPAPKRRQPGSGSHEPGV